MPVPALPPHTPATAHPLPLTFCCGFSPFNLNSALAGRIITFPWLGWAGLGPALLLAALKLGQRAAEGKEEVWEAGRQAEEGQGWAGTGGGIKEDGDAGGGAVQADCRGAKHEAGTSMAEQARRTKGSVLPLCPHHSSREDKFKTTFH